MGCWDAPPRPPCSPVHLLLAGWRPACVSGSTGGTGRLRNLGAAHRAPFTSQRSQPLLGRLGSDSGRPFEEGLPEHLGQVRHPGGCRAPPPPSWRHTVVCGTGRCPPCSAEARPSQAACPGLCQTATGDSARRHGRPGGAGSEEGSQSASGRPLRGGRAVVEDRTWLLSSPGDPKSDFGRKAGWGGEQWFGKRSLCAWNHAGLVLPTAPLWGRCRLPLLSDGEAGREVAWHPPAPADRKSTRLNSSH